MNVLQLFKQLDKYPSYYKMAYLDLNTDDPNGELLYIQDFGVVHDSDDEITLLFDYCNGYDDYDDAISVVDLINSLTDYIEEVKEYVNPKNIIIKADYNKDLWGSGLLNDIATVSLFSDNEIEE